MFMRIIGGWNDIEYESIYDRYMEKRRRIVQDDHLFAIQWGLRGRRWSLEGRLGRPAERRSQRLPLPTPRPNLTMYRRRLGEASRVKGP